LVNVLPEGNIVESAKGRYAAGVMISTKSWNSSVYWVATGALIGAIGATQTAPGAPNPQALLMSTGALVFGFGAGKARGMLFPRERNQRFQFLGMVLLGFIGLWGSTGGISLLSDSRGAPFFLTLSLASIGVCWISASPSIQTSLTWRCMLGLLGGLFGSLHPGPAILSAGVIWTVFAANNHGQKKKAEHLSLPASALSTVAGFTAGGIWMASRTSLDASGGGFHSSAILFVLLFLCTRLPAWKDARQAIMIGIFLIFTLLSMGLLPVLVSRLFQPEDALFPRTAILQAWLMLGPALILRSSLSFKGPSLWGIGAGLLFSSFAGAHTYGSVLIIVALVGLGNVLLAKSLPARVAGLGLLALSAFSAPHANPGRAMGLSASWNQVALNLDQLTPFQSAKIFQRHQRFLKSRILLSSGFSPFGSFAVLQPERGRAELALDGIIHQFDSRSADTQRLIPHLATALHPSPLKALVLGDPLGLMTEGLIAQEVDRIHVAVPLPQALQALVKAEPSVADTLLGSTVRLIKGTPDTLLNAQTDTDLILEMAFSPWSDSQQGLPRKKDLKKRRDHLSNLGVYALGVDLHWLTPEQMKGLLYDFQSVFPQSWAFLPPKDADQIILCGWQSPQTLEWDRFVQTLYRGKTLLAALDIQSPFDLADRGLAGGSALAVIGKADDSSSMRWMRNLTPSSPPLLPLFIKHVQPEALFPENTELAAILKERGKTTSGFLQLLADNASGNLEEVFKASRALLTTESGARSLNPLVAPYLESARTSMTNGRKQGSISNAWEKARTSLTAALLLNPNSAEAHALLGEVHLATGRLGPATKSFLRALDIEPGQRTPLLGLGQIAIQQNDIPSAEVHLREAHIAHPNDWLPAYNLGAFLMNHGLTEEAESVLRKSTAWAEDKHAAPHTALAQLYLSRGEATAALLEAHRAIGIEKNAMNAYVLGKAYFEVEQTDSAIQYFQRSVLADPGFWQARAGMGVIFAESGDWDRCVSAFERVLELEQNNQAAQQNLSHCQAQQKP
jgi:tetratricopeptide (TPR) repeat protein